MSFLVVDGLKTKESPWFLHKETQPKNFNLWSHSTPKTISSNISNRKNNLKLWSKSRVFRERCWVEIRAKIERNFLRDAIGKPEVTQLAAINSDYEKIDWRWQNPL